MQAAKKSIKDRRRLIPKHMMNVRTLPWRIREWERKGKLEHVERSKSIYAEAVRELRALGVEFNEPNAQAHPTHCREEAR